MSTREEPTKPNVYHAKRCAKCSITFRTSTGCCPQCGGLGEPVCDAPTSMSEHAELLTEARELVLMFDRKLAMHRSRTMGVGFDRKCATQLRTLADLVEKYHKSNAQLIAACNTILAGPVNESPTLEWAQGVIKAAPDERTPDESH